MGRDFTDFVDEGRALMQSRDKNSWSLGDLACEFEIVLGRPTDPEAPTLSDLAAEWDASTQRVSEWRNVSAFYVRSVRTFDRPWEIYNAARRAAQKEHKDYEEALEKALSLLAEADRQHMGVAAFRRFINGILYEGDIDSSELPPRIKAIMPNGIQEMWIVIKPKRNTDE